MTEQETKLLKDLVVEFSRYEDECINEIHFLEEHNFNIQKEVVDIKRQAYHDCYRELRRVVDKLINP